MSGKDRLKKHITGFHYLRTDAKALELLDQLHVNNFVRTEAVVYNDVEVCQEYLDGIWFYVYYDEPIGGLGLGAARDIPANTDLMLYAGDVITKEDKKKMVEQEAKSATDDKGEVLTNYLLPVEGDNYIDARQRGNLSRFINHACNPQVRNVRFIQCSISDKSVVKLRSRIPIPQDEVIWGKFASCSEPIQERYKVERCRCPHTTHHIIGKSARKRFLHVNRTKKGFSKRVHLPGGFGYAKKTAPISDPESSDYSDPMNEKPIFS